MTMLSPEATDRLDSIFDSVDPLERDRPWGRPLLIPRKPLAEMPLRGRKTKANPNGILASGKIPYTRASSLGNYVADHTALEIWRRRSLTYGLSQREDLCARAAGLPPIISNLKNIDTMSRAERDQDRLTNALLDEIAEAAEIYANRDYKADWGTAIHSFTDPGPHGDVPERMRADVASFERVASRWVLHATEVFTANDDSQSAGTFDHLVSMPAFPELGAMVVDKKTGLLHPDGFSIQMASYARGEVYDPYTNERHPLEDLTDGIPINREVGIIAHIPVGMGRTDLYVVDLVAGWEGVELACQVRSFRQRSKDFLVPRDFIAEERLQVAGLLSAATSVDELRGIRQQAIKDGLWVKALEDLALQKRSEITA
jgi:hypothetical protein